jgi:hypothetical protein
MKSSYSYSLKVAGKKTENIIFSCDGSGILKVKCFKSELTLDEYIDGYKIEPTSSTYNWIERLIHESKKIFIDIRSGLKSAESDRQLYVKIMLGIIRAVKELDIRFFNEPHMLADLSYDLWIYSEGNEFDDFLRICLDDKYEEWFKTDFENKQIEERRPVKDREGVLLEIVFNEQGHVRRSVIKATNGITHTRIIQWFLENYDLYHLAKFEKATSINTTREKAPVVSTRPGGSGGLGTAQDPRASSVACFYLKSIGWFVVPLVVTIFLGSVVPAELDKNLGIVAISKFPDLFGSISTLMDGILALLWQIRVVLFIIIFIIFARAPSFHYFFSRHSMLQRLAVCLLAGFVTGNAYGLTACEKTVSWDVFGRGCVFCVFTYLYIWHTVRNKLAKSINASGKLKSESIKRSFAFISRAAGYSLIVGIIMSDYVSNNLLPVKLKTAADILVQAPLALFVGIFITLLFQDKPLTEPL